MPSIRGWSASTTWPVRSSASWPPDAHNWLGHHNAARAAVESLVDGPDWVASVSVPGVMAVAATSEGRLVAGQQLATHSLDVARRIGIEHNPAVIDAHLALGAIHRERDELDRADRHVNEALQLCRHGTGLAWLAAAELERAALLMAQGRLEDSYAVVSRLRPANRTEGSRPKSGPDRSGRCPLAPCRG